MPTYEPLWFSEELCTFHTGGKSIHATPVVVNTRHGVTVGLVQPFSYTLAPFGSWFSGNTCSPWTAWRVAVLLSQLKTLSTDNGYDSTITGLVIAVEGDQNESRLYNRALELGMTLGELQHELKQVRRQWPSAGEILFMWDRMTDSQQEAFAPPLDEAVRRGDVDEVLASRVAKAMSRVQAKNERIQHEDKMILEGLDVRSSLRQLLADIGVTNLAFTADADFFAPSHFNFDDLDREIMRELIGGDAFSREILLETTSRGPDDTAAHHSAGGNGVTMLWSDFGKCSHPRIELGGAAMEIRSVRWDHSADCFMLKVMPHGGQAVTDGFEVSIESLRGQLDLPPGKLASWVCQKAPKKKGLRQLFSLT